MELKRKLAMVAATLAVALGAGHLMQSGLGVQAGREASAEGPKREDPTQALKGIVPLAAGLATTPAPATAIAEREAPALPAPALPDAAFARPQVAPAISGQAELSAPVALEVVPKTIAADAPDSVSSEVTLSGDSTICPVTLDVMASAQATLDLTLLAPCRASERVVIRHGGLTVTAMTSLTGTLFTSIPGMEVSGTVSLLFGDGLEVSAIKALPDLPLYRRFAVQWMADDAFQINAFENGALFGEEGHVSATNPQRRIANVPMKGGYLSLLGDGTAPLPMLAEVYTFPLATDDKAIGLTIEASVTEATCDRELLGEVLLSEVGKVTKLDLTMAMPTCDAIGDVLVLNNPLPDLKLAAAN